MRIPARKVAAPRTRVAEPVTFSAPVAGWIKNRALSLPNTGAQGATVLENWFPTATGSILRRGSMPHAQMPTETPVKSIFKYVVGNNRKLFAATDDAIYDVTSLASPVNILIGTDPDEIGEDEDYTIGEFSILEENIMWTGAAGGDWFTVQFSVTGGVFLIGVNGKSVGFIYDGTAFYPNVAGGVWALSYDAEVTPFAVGATVTGGTSGATGTILEIIEGVNPGEGALVISGDAGLFQNDETVTDDEGGEATASSDAASLVPGVEFTGNLTTADMAFVWVYKNTLWFAQEESLSAWYLPVDNIGGEATEFPLGAEFGQGGSLLLGQAWSLSASGQGGLSEQNVFLSSEGEAVVYQGSHPSVSDSWAKVGTYRTGTPMGRRAFIRAGGDLIFATTIGFVSLSTAVQVDLAALAPKAVSFAIEDAWNEMVSQRGRVNWVCCLWPESQMVAIAPPTGDNSPLFLVSNARTGAWAPFTNWNALCMEIFEGGMYFGTPDGFVMQAMVGGTDNGIPFTGTYMPLFSDAGRPTAHKTALIGRTELISATDIKEQMSCRFDFAENLPAPPDVEPVPVGNEWNNAVWDESVWSSGRATVITKRRHSVSGHGYRLAPVLQVTSGAAIPLDVQIVTVDITYQTGDAFT